MPAFRNRGRQVAASAGLLFLISLSGCGGNAHRLETVPVSGIVTFDGKPAERLSISFVPATGRAANGMTDAEGRFELTTYEKGDGAVPGEHRVTITPSTDPPAEMLGHNAFQRPTRKPPELLPIPKKYFEPSTTELTATVTPDEENTFTFDIRPE
jgi:hypothetical protein